MNNLNQYLTVGGEPLSYDANGTLTSMPGLSLQYDSWNRLISATTGSNLVLFAYDGRHRCVKRVEIQHGLGRTTIMIWGHEPSQGWGLLEDRGANGELIARHVHGPSVDDLVLSELGGAVYYYHHDHLNSTIAVTDENGAVVEQYRYGVYGQPYFYGPDGTPRSESPLGIRFLFTGREWLASLALYDYRHRAYSPSPGRFLQMDPMGFGADSINLYSYVLNNAVYGTDPYGLIHWPTVGRAVLGIAQNIFGLFVGAGLLSVPEPTMGTKITGGIMLVKSGYGVWANFLNLGEGLFLDREGSSKGSLLNDVAALIEPENKTAQQLATAADLTTDLTASVIAKYAAFRAIGKYWPYDVECRHYTNPANLGPLVDALVAVDCIRILLESIEYYKEKENSIVTQE